MFNKIAFIATILLLVACGESAKREGLRLGASETPYAEINLGAYLDCAREQGVTLLQAHRAGDRPGAAENSIGALDASLVDGATFIELDVARTADGVLILMHDDTFERTTTGSGSVNASSYASLAEFTLVDVDGQDTGEPIPTLADALKALEGRGFAQLDRKRPASFAEIAAVVEAEGAVDRTVIITYSIEEAIAVHDRLPGVMLSTGIDSLEDVAALRAAGVDLSRVSAWLGLGAGKPDLDIALAELGIETSYGDFRAERRGGADYRRMARNGAEVISVDDVPMAAAALNARVKASALLSACSAAQE